MDRDIELNNKSGAAGSARRGGPEEQ